MAALTKFLTTACTATRRLTPSAGDVITAGRCLHTVDTTKSDDGDGETIKHSKNVSLSSGPKTSFVTKITEKGMYVRVDMPGVEKNGIKVWVENGSVFFQGKGVERGDYEEGRSYAGKIVFSTATFGVKDLEVTLKDGVLRMMIPKNNPVIYL